jgi:hypothetical protein
MKFPLHMRIPISTMERRGGAGYCYTLNWVDTTLLYQNGSDPWGIHEMPKSLNRKQQGKE